MNRLRFALFALTALFLFKATVQCWDSSQRGAENCEVAAKGSTTANKPKTRLVEVVSVKDFGAIGDGNTDDHRAITAAMAAATGSVFFPPGTYLISTPLKISKPIVLTGSGSGSVIKAVDCNSRWPHEGDGAPLISIRPSGASFSNVIVEKLTLDGSCASRSYGTWEWNAGIEVAAFRSWSPRNVRLRELHIKDVGGDGITVRGDPTTTAHSASPDSIHIEDNFIERWHQNRQGVAVIAGRRVRIANNHLVLGIPSSGTCPATTSNTTDPSSANFGIDLETNHEDTGDVITQIQISDNIIHNCNGGINIANQNYPHNAVSNVAVHDNTTMAYGGRPLKPLQVNGPGVTGYVEHNNRTGDEFRIFQSESKF